MFLSRISRAGAQALLCLFILLGQASAQDADRLKLPVLGLKTNLFALLSPELPTATLSAEMKLSRQFTAQLEGGLLLPSYAEITTAETSQHRGYRIQPSVRFYYEEAGTRFFLEALYRYQSANLDIVGDWRYAPEGQLSYNRRIEYDGSLQRQGLYLSFGIRVATAGRFFFECSAGLGRVWRKEKYFGYPEEASFITNGSPYFNPRVADEDRSRAGGLLSLALGYVLF